MLPSFQRMFRPTLQFIHMCPLYSLTPLHCRASFFVRHVKCLQYGNMNAPSYFEIQADDLKRASAFYADIFAWKFAKTEGLAVEYWRIETEGPRGGLLKRP